MEVLNLDDKGLLDIVTVIIILDDIFSVLQPALATIMQIVLPKYIRLYEGHKRNIEIRPKCSIVVHKSAVIM